MMALRRSRVIAPLLLKLCTLSEVSFMHWQFYPPGKESLLLAEQESVCTSCRRAVAYLLSLPEISPTFSIQWREPEVAYCGDTPGGGAVVGENTARNPFRIA
jgi:hypothetical protein